jgi:hypothetical protein
MVLAVNHQIFTVHVEFVVQNVTGQVYLLVRAHWYSCASAFDHYSAFIHPKYHYGNGQLTHYRRYFRQTLFHSSIIINNRI